MRNVMVYLVLLTLIIPAIGCRRSSSGHTPWEVPDTGAAVDSGDPVLPAAEGYAGSGVCRGALVGGLSVMFDASLDRGLGLSGRDQRPRCSLGRRFPRGEVVAAHCLGLVCQPHMLKKPHES